MPFQIRAALMVMTLFTAALFSPVALGADDSDDLGGAKRTEQTIQAGVALKTDGSCTAAVGFVVEVARDKDQARRAAEKQLRARYPKANDSNYKDNYKKDKYLGRHLVVVSAALTEKGCAGHAMGIGFGKDEPAARKNAEKNMEKHFTYAPASVKVEHSKTY